MYELIWNFFFNTLFGFGSSGIPFDESINFSNPFYKSIEILSSTVTQVDYMFSFDIYPLAQLFAHVLTIVSFVMIFLAFVNLIKGLFKVVGGGFKW